MIGAEIRSIKATGAINIIRPLSQGIAFVDLAPLTAHDQIPTAIAQAVGLPLEGASEQGRSVAQQVLDFLANRRLLLLLDNAEHLLDGAPFIAEIMATTPAVQILVTSRAPLRLSGEQLYPLHGLDYAAEPSSVGGSDVSAVALFLQAARRVRPDYGFDDDPERMKGTLVEQAAIAAICRLVERMPLAIELAASWVAVMSAAEILAAIHESLGFLETDLREVSARHRSNGTTANDCGRGCPIEGENIKSTGGSGTIVARSAGVGVGSALIASHCPTREMCEKHPTGRTQPADSGAVATGGAGWAGGAGAAAGVGSVRRGRAVVGGSRGIVDSFYTMLY